MKIKINNAIKRYPKIILIAAKISQITRLKISNKGFNNTVDNISSFFRMMLA